MNFFVLTDNVVSLVSPGLSNSHRWHLLFLKKSFESEVICNSLNFSKTSVDSSSTETFLWLLSKKTKQIQFQFIQQKIYLFRTLDPVHFTWCITMLNFCRWWIKFFYFHSFKLFQRRLEHAIKFHWLFDRRLERAFKWIGSSKKFRIFLYIRFQIIQTVFLHSWCMARFGVFLANPIQCNCNVIQVQYRTIKRLEPNTRIFAAFETFNKNTFECWKDVVGRAEKLEVISADRFIENNIQIVFSTL